MVAQPDARWLRAFAGASTSRPASTTSSTSATPIRGRRSTGRTSFPRTAATSVSSCPAGSEVRDAPGLLRPPAGRLDGAAARGGAEHRLVAARSASGVPGEGGLPLPLRGVRGVAARPRPFRRPRSPSGSWGAIPSATCWTRRSSTRWWPDARWPSGGSPPSRPWSRARSSSSAPARCRVCPRSWPGCSGAPVLTVGEADRFARRGGMIGFFFEDNRVRLEVNRAAAERAGLRVSSKLLAVARLVKPDGAESGGAR